MRSTLLLVLLLINSVHNSDFIRKMVKQVSAQCPEMKKMLEKDPGFQASALRPIVGRGFTYYHQRLDGVFYGGVMGDVMNDFLQDVGDDMQFENKEQKKQFVNLFALSEFSGSNFLLMPRIMFRAKDPVNKGRFFVGLSEKRNDDSVDFLFLNVRTSFQLAPDVFLATKSDRTLFWGKSEQYLITRPRYLTMDQAEKLFTFFQISMFQSAEKIMNYVKALE